MDTLKTNTFKVVGQLTQVDLKEGFRTNGDSYISGKITIVSSIGGSNKTYEVALYANKMTAQKKENQLYISYTKLNELLNKKIEVTGEIRESRFYSSNGEQMVSSQQLSGRFVHGVAAATPDEGSFELGGFVVEELKEKTNKDGEVYRYDLTLGQVNYNGTSMQRFVVHVDPSDFEIVKGAKEYKVGQTVSINGDLDFVVEEKTVAVNREGGFGEAVTRTYINKTHCYYIKGGSAPITNVENGAYPNDLIRSLVSTYKARDVELMAKAKNSGADTNAAATEETRLVSRQTSLI